MRWFNWDAERIAAHFRVDPAVGLEDKEVLIRLREIGPNQIIEGEKKSYLTLFINQFKDFMVLILLLATLISGILGEYTDAIAILMIVILNACMGFIQEMRAEKSLSALKKLSAPKAYVLRNHNWSRISATKLVPGDIVQVKSGDRIPADIRFLQVKGLNVEESALTGESLPVSKAAETLPAEELSLGDRTNMGYMGTMVVRGSGIGVVVGTGMNTEMGQIAHLIHCTTEMETPLQRRLEQLGKILITISILLTGVVVFTGIVHGHDAYKMFLAGVSLAVAAIPEGLPAIVTVVLALGVQRMIKRKAIVRKLPSVETLGCATVICSDKTGTLTQNKMMVTNLWVDRMSLTVSGSGYKPQGEFRHGDRTIDPVRSYAMKRMLEISALCNNTSLSQKQVTGKISKKQKENWEIDGDPTEGALVVLAAKAGMTRDKLDTAWTREGELPFDSNRKMMSTVTSNRGETFLFSKGAPDILLKKCTHLLYQGKKTLLTDSLRQEIMEANECLARGALRVLGLAYRELASIPPEQMESLHMEKQLIFVGLAGMIDPPRTEVKDSLQICKEAGIKTVMITGDHVITARAIAENLGIKSKEGLVVDGTELARMSDQELQNKVEQIDIFARVTPEHKLRIVKALQNANHVVAMTGDGVNDAPAIKAADIGISMGITGTDVSKESSSLVLADDNFSTIVAAIEEGRNIYENIRKFISYLLASNVGEILVMFFAMLMALPLPLVPIQILWVNLVTDGLPAMALGVDPAETSTMNQKPRRNKESVFARGVGWKIITRGSLIGVCSLLAFWITYKEQPDNLVLAQTVAFATLVLCQLIYVFDCRCKNSIFGRNPLDNMPLLLAVFSSVALLLVVIYYPALQPIFHTVALGMREWMLICVTSTLPVLLAGLIDRLRFGKFVTN